MTSCCSLEPKLKTSVSQCRKIKRSTETGSSQQTISLRDTLGKYYSTAYWMVTVIWLISQPLRLFRITLYLRHYYKHPDQPLKDTSALSNRKKKQKKRFLHHQSCELRCLQAPSPHVQTQTTATTICGLSHPVHPPRRRWRSLGGSCNESLRRRWNCSAAGGVGGRAPPGRHTVRAAAGRGLGPPLPPCLLSGPRCGRNRWPLERFEHMDVEVFFFFFSVLWCLLKLTSQSVCARECV